MASEQAMLDNNWTTAWDLMSQPTRPPFTEWGAMDVEGMKKEQVHSRLADPGWIGAISGKVKDEDVLRKRRGEQQK